jgi:hypothetical protein
MALTLDYPDAYLAKFCTDEREARAFAEVDLLPPFDETWDDQVLQSTWRDRCARLKVYCIACIENQSAPDDLFSTKLKSYRAEFSAEMARAAAAAEVTTAALVFSVPLERA